MNNISWELRRKENTRSFNFANKAYDLALSCNYKKGIAESLLCLSVYDSNIGNFSDSLEKL
jgi:hypothetical protein